MNKILKNHSGKVFGLVMIALLGLSIFYSHQAGAENNEGVVVEDRVKGNPDAEVVLVKYGDFECPYCAAAYPVVDALVEEFGDTLRFEYKHLPLSSIHPNAIPASKAAEAAGQQDKFFEYHDLLYDRQREWSRAGAPAAKFIEYAKELSLDMDLFKKHQNSSLLSERVRSDSREAFRRGFQSTPTFTLNGDRITYQNPAQLRALIVEALGIDGVETEASETSDIEFVL